MHVYRKTCSDGMINEWEGEGGWGDVKLYKCATNTICTVAAIQIKGSKSVAYS